MRKICTGGMIVASLIGGCGPKTGPAANPNIKTDSPTLTVAQDPTHESDPVIATAGSVQIRESSLVDSLKEAYGLGMLMYIVQRDIAWDVCREQGMVISVADVAQERTWTLDQMFQEAKPGEDREKLLEQLLNQPKPRSEMMTNIEFDLIIQTNAALRKISQASLKDAITEESLKQQFDERYGSSVRVRFIQLTNQQEVQKVKRLLASGEDFATVASVESREPNSKRMGGLLPPFTINDRRYPEVFRQVAFNLKEGEVSDPVQAGGSWHLIKLEKRIAPKAVKYEDVKDSLREDIQNRLVIEAMKAIRDKIGVQALANLQVRDPILKEEFNTRLKARELIKDKEKIKQEMEKQRLAPTTKPDDSTDQPEISPATVPAAAPPAPAGAPIDSAPSTVPASQP